MRRASTTAAKKSTTARAAWRRPATRATRTSTTRRSRLSCQKNFIVLLTDGEPTKDHSADSTITSLQDANGDTFRRLRAGRNVRSGDVSGRASVRTAASASTTSPNSCTKAIMSTLPGAQNVTTYTIGFTVDLPILADTAARGGGKYYTANDTASLSTALTNIVTSILDTQTTFLSPTVSVNSFNQHAQLERSFHQRLQGLGQHALARQPQEIPPAIRRRTQSSTPTVLPQSTRQRASSPTRRRVFGRRARTARIFKPAAPPTRSRHTTPQGIHVHLGSPILTAAGQQRLDDEQPLTRHDAQHRPSPATRRTTTSSTSSTVST